MKTQGKYNRPVDASAAALMTFDRSPAHKGRLQKAVDFIIPVGTPIRGSRGGVVVDVRQDSDQGGDDPRFDQMGNYIEIQHEGEEYSIYEHLKQHGSLVKVGDTISRGQVIGYAGATGWLGGLGPYLHFDVHRYYGQGAEDDETLEIRWAE